MNAFRAHLHNSKSSSYLKIINLIILAKALFLHKVTFTDSSISDQELISLEDYYSDYYTQRGQIISLSHKSDHGTPLLKTLQ